MIRTGASDAVLVLNGDSLSNHDLRAQLDQHERARPAVTVHVRATQDARGMGLVERDDNGTVTRFLEKPPCKVAGLVNAGTYVLSRWAVEELAAVGSASLERDVLPGWAAEGLVRAHREDSYLADVGTIDGYLSTTRDLVLGLVATTVGVRTSAPGVHREAVVDGSAQVGDGSFVDTGAHVGARTAVLRSVLMPGSQVGADCRVTDAVLAPGAVVPDGSTVSGVVTASR